MKKEIIKQKNRFAGILMPIFSLPSNYGIGTLGKEAYKFIDFLADAKQTYWQVLPLGPTGFGDSPYQTLSSFAGNPYFIDLDMLKEEGLIENSDLKSLCIKNESKINYSWLFNNRLKILYKAYTKGIKIDKHNLVTFIKNNNSIHDYAVYYSIKEYFDMKTWVEWPDISIKKREPNALKKYCEKLKDRIEFYEYTQFLFFKQFNKLKDYMKLKGIKLIGDIPMYVPLDSCDCWINPECFDLNDQFFPKAIAGVPPDYFSRNGQLWGNPLYNYKNMKKNNYQWWVNRISGSIKLYDVIRIDHFRGFETYWSIPYGNKNAKNGKWVKGPNIELLNVFKDKYKNVEFIAEDLGCHTSGVQKLLDESGFPGMKILEFGFDYRGMSSHAPHNYIENSVCYVGTHDNSTIIGWLKSANKKDVCYALKYLGIEDKNNFNWNMIIAGMSSVSKIFIAQLQDYLGLDDRARINKPGTFGNNWKWRLKKGQINKKLAHKIKEYTIMYDR